MARSKRRPGNCTVKLPNPDLLKPFIRTKTRNFPGPVINAKCYCMKLFAKFRNLLLRNFFGPKFAGLILGVASWITNQVSFDFSLCPTK